MTWPQVSQFSQSDLLFQTERWRAVERWPAIRFLVCVCSPLQMQRQLPWTKQHRRTSTGELFENYWSDFNEIFTSCWQGYWDYSIIFLRIKVKYFQSYSSSKYTIRLILHPKFAFQPTGSWVWHYFARSSSACWPAYRTVCWNPCCPSDSTVWSSRWRRCCTTSEWHSSW